MIIAITLSADDYRLIKEQAARAQVSVHDFIVVSARWHAVEVTKIAQPTRMPPVMPD